MKKEGLRKAFFCEFCEILEKHLFIKHLQASAFENSYTANFLKVFLKTNVL